MTRPGGRAAEQLHEPVLQVGHLGPGVAGQRQHHRPGRAPGQLSTSAWETPTVASSGSVKTLAETVLQPQRGDRLAERVPHRDPALHGGDAGQRQHAGAVAGGVDAGHVGPGDPVDGDVAAVGDARRRTRRGPDRRCSGTEPTAISACEPSTVRPSASVDHDAVGGAADRRRPGRWPGSSCRATGTRRSIAVGRVGVLVRHDPVPAGDQGHVDPGGQVGAGELGPGHAGADDDQPLRQLGQVVDLAPGEDPLAVGQGGRAGRRGVAPVAISTVVGRRPRTASPSAGVTTTGWVCPSASLAEAGPPVRPARRRP